MYPSSFYITYHRQVLVDTGKYLKGKYGSRSILFVHITIPAQARNKIANLPFYCSTQFKNIKPNVTSSFISRNVLFCGLNQTKENIITYLRYYKPSFKAMFDCRIMTYGQRWYHGDGGQCGAPGGQSPLLSGQQGPALELSGCPRIQD